MVTTNSTRPGLNFEVRELEFSEVEADREIARKAREQLMALVKALLPVLVYVDHSLNYQYHDIRGIEVVPGLGSRDLLLLRNGEWATRYAQDIAVSEDCWADYSFQKIIEGLKKAFDGAKAKKEEHLKAIARRSDLLDGISEMIAASK